MKFKADLNVNKTQLKVGSVVEQLNEVTNKCLKKLKRKAPTSCSVEVIKRLEKDGGDHNDQGPSHHEGETKEPIELKPTEPSTQVSEPKTSEPQTTTQSEQTQASEHKPAEPTQSIKEQLVPQK